MTTKEFKPAVLTAKGVPPKPRRAPGPKETPKLEAPDMIPAVMRDLYDQLDAMPVEELRKTASNFKIKWQDMPKPEIIEQILAAEEDGMRKAKSDAAARAVAPPAEKVVPANPDVYQADGMATVDFAPIDLALIYAALLPPDAVLNIQSGTAQTYSRHASRYEQQNAVVYSKMDSKGIERRYLIQVEALTPIVVVELP